MGFPQAGRDLIDKVHGRLRLQRPVLDLVPKRLPFHEFHGDVGPVLAFPDFVDDADVRVGESCSRLGLDQEASLELG